MLKIVKRTLAFLIFLFFANIAQPSPVAVNNGGFGSAGYTARAVLCGGTTATAPVQSVGPGTSGQLLISNGAGALPSFQDNPGSFVYLTTVSASAGVAIIDNTVFTSTYNKYLMIFEIFNNAITNVTLQYSIDNNATSVTTNYLSGFINHPYNSTAYTMNSTTGVILGRFTTVGGNNIYGYIIFQGLNRSASTGPYAFGQVASQSGTANGYIYSINTGSFNVNSATITFTDGGAGGGTVDIFGIVD